MHQGFVPTDWIKANGGNYPTLSLTCIAAVIRPKMPQISSTSPSPWGSPTVSTLNEISIRSAVLAQRRRVIGRHTTLYGIIISYRSEQKAKVIWQTPHRIPLHLTVGGATRSGPPRLTQYTLGPQECSTPAKKGTLDIFSCLCTVQPS